MSDTLKTFLLDGKLKGSYLTIKLIKQISQNSHLVADSSMVAILDISDAISHGKILLNGCWYRLIKCIKIDNNTVGLNRKFKPVKTLMKEEVDIKETVISEMEKKIAESSMLPTLPV